MINRRDNRKHHGARQLYEETRAGVANVEDHKSARTASISNRFKDEKLYFFPTNTAKASL